MKFIKKYKFNIFDKSFFTSNPISVFDMANKEHNQENFMIGPVFESVIVGQCNEMKKLLGCENRYIREFLYKLADKYFM